MNTVSDAPIIGSSFTFLITGGGRGELTKADDKSKRGFENGFKGGEAVLEGFESDKGEDSVLIGGRLVKSGRDSAAVARGEEEVAGVGKRGENVFGFRVYQHQF